MAALIADLWQSFRALPLWVQIWVALILVPVNAASLLFVTYPGGLWIAVLANGAMILNLPIMLRERGLSKTMALPHVAIWPFLVLLIVYQLYFGGPVAGFAAYLWILLVVDVISLAFDFKDTRDWWRGDRTPAGR
jgi:hypothetical protein